MIQESFRAMVVAERSPGVFDRSIVSRKVADLPSGDVLIRVHYSSLNYKDALSATGNKGVTRSYPHTPGIDAAGVVAESASSGVCVGDKVLVTGYDLGVNTPGGYGQFIRVPAEWVIPLPDDMSLEESMMYGTAGLTAALSVMRLKTLGVMPGSGDILVTGATGGVGSLAVAILARAGYRVTAASGKPDATDFLHHLGAERVVDRSEVLDVSPRPLLKGAWAGVVDTVGGDFLATAIKSTRIGGAVTCCGNVASPELHTSVFPFILRGVSLLGIDSVNCTREDRFHIWNNLAGEWKVSQLHELSSETALDDLEREIQLILKGGQKGRIVVNLWK